MQDLEFWHDELQHTRAFLASYFSINPAFDLEAKFSLSRIEEILSNPDCADKIKNFLANRWETIIHSNLEYLQDFENPINQLCIKLAKHYSKNEPYLSWLMPSLTNFNGIYITSDYKEDVELRHCIISDCGTRLINVVDVLSFAIEDGILKHNSVIFGHSDKLSEKEQERLFSRHPKLLDTFNAISELVTFKTHGPSVGAALTRLINGLRMGGFTQRGTHLEAEFSANVAIVEFHDFLQTCSRATKKAIFKANKVDRFESETVVVKSVGDYWKILSSTSLRDDEDQRFCTYLIAVYLEEILEANPSFFCLLPKKNSKDYKRLNELTSIRNKLLNECYDEVSSVSFHQGYPLEQVGNFLKCFIINLNEHPNFKLSKQQLSYFIYEWFDTRFKFNLALNPCMKLLLENNMTFYLEAKSEFTNEINKEISTLLNNSLVPSCFFTKDSKKHRTEGRDSYEFYGYKRL